ncbi:MAG: T9SS type A sorting domain-containing protein [Bacteroidales bacterium]|nr:T9SS type A sorting domain-containing protein [Bacteroidales bacterium]MCF8402742.1 T9SS type A sorting domain-containing protein [Bacteroidales bacterium]
MIKKLLFVFVVIALLPIEMKADWVSLDGKTSVATQPQVTIISDDNSGTVLKINISGFDLSEFNAENKTYQKVDLLSEIFTINSSLPEVPYLAKVLAIPDQAGISIDILEVGEVQTFDNIYLPPARESWYEGDPETPYFENQKVYESNDAYPSEYVMVDPPSVFRDFRIARVSIYPLRYIPGKKQLQAVSSLTVRINYGQGVVINPKTTPKKKIAPSFGKIYRSFIANYQTMLDNLYDGKEDGHEVILCIMDDSFVDAFQVYADWKRESGTDVHVTAFSDINANANNPEIIKTHITDAYNNWEYPPTYVLVVGDDGYFPKKIVTYPDYSFPSEDYFVCVAGNDYFPEMMIGRFTNQGVYRMQVMMNKFMLYEKTPYIAQTDWFKKGVCCSNNAYPSQVETKRYAASMMMDYGQFTSVDTMMSDGNGWGSGCTYHLSDILSAINDGRSYLNYRGEGWYYGWYANCYDFSPSDVSGLANGQKFTFVTSIGCGVAMFDSNGGNCFGEEWVQLGSLTEPRGGVAFLGPTSNTHTTYNNKIDKGIYTGMFMEDMDTPGQALLRGKLYMYNVYGNEYYVEYHYKIYCCLGDPSLHVWKDIPLAVNVNHVTTTNVGNDVIEVDVNFASNGNPVDTAEVCITGQDIFVTGETGPDGKVYLEITPLFEETLTVTVRGGNVYPYQGTIEVTQPSQLVEPEGIPVIADLDGNLDGLVNPNENCTITYTLKNWGDLTANNVWGTLTTSNPEYVEIITTAPVGYGNLVPGGMATGDPFQFFVNSSCPIGQMVTLNLHVTCDGNNWDYQKMVEVTGCMLAIDNFLVYDDSSPNSNYRMDPGETVNVVISLENYGTDTAPDVMGVLGTDDPYITIIDSMGVFGTINPENISINALDNFKVSVSSSCPTEYMATYTLKIYTQGGNYPYQIIPEFEIPVGMLIASDYTGPDAYGYYAYASTDAFFEQTPVYNWVEIDAMGTQIAVPNISDYTTTVTLPFTFKYYGINYTQVRVSTDGWMALGSGTQVAPVNTGLPNNDNVGSMAAVFWDDLYDITMLDGQIYYYNDDANHRFIIEWDSISHNNFVSEPKKEVFQAILLDPAYYPTITGDGEIIYQYKQAKELGSMTIGIENHSQNIGLQYVFDNDYDPTAETLTSGLAIKFTTEPPYLYIITDIEDHFENGIISQNGYILEQNKPNPFNSQTHINYTLPVSVKVGVNIYNINGELVRALHDGFQSAGKHTLIWDGQDDGGNTVKSGVYFYRLQTEEFVGTMKMFLLK